MPNWPEASMSNRLEATLAEMHLAEMRLAECNARLFVRIVFRGSV